MKTMKIAIILFSIFVFVNQLIAQDLFLSQPQESPVMLNPANAGLFYPYRTSINYRQQWRSILTTPFTTVLASFDTRIATQENTGSSLGIGIYVSNDMAGSGKLNTLNANIAIMGKILLGEKHFLSTGITGGVMQRKVDYNSLTFYDQFDGYSYNSSILSGEQFSTEQRLAPDIGVGIQWSYNTGSATLSSNDAFGAQAGFSAYHVNMPNTGFHEDIDKRYIRYLFHSSVSIGIKNTPFQINPIIIAQMQGPSKMFYGGSYIKYRLQESSRYTGNLLSRSLNIGSFYRLGDSFVAVVQLEWDKFAFGISYDLTLSNLTTYNNGRGATEFSFRFIPVKPNVANRLL
ncbi:MAG: PorP/SprF family type IX secretion system membrane protein [Bacteroidales bacterium]|nr:PorP/SprF family type IX secretion system membrane protein [Bacteroidales bacterium]